MGDSLYSAGMILLALFLVLLNGFFVAAEFAIVKVRATRIDELVAKNRFGARKAQEAVRHLDAYLSATQLGITLASLGLGWIGEPAIAHLIEPLLEGRVGPKAQAAIAFTIAFTIITFLHIVIGELAPKSLAIQRAEATTLAIIYPLDWFYKLFRLPIFLLNNTAAIVLRLFGLRNLGEGEGEAHSEEELRLILNASHAGGEIKSSELKLVNQVLDFAHRQAREIMVPRPDIIFLTTEKTISENIAVTERAGFTRYPLCTGTPDDVVGMVHIKDLLSLARRNGHGANEDEACLREIARPLLRVPETKPIDQMLRNFQREHQQLAIVVDEYGGTAGMVTLEDILEEIVGDIQDEFDRTSPELEPAGKDCYHVDARMSLGKLERTLDFTPPEKEAEVDTVGGFVMTTLGGGARTGASVPYGTATFTITEMTGRRVRKVRVCIPEPAFTTGALSVPENG